MSKKMVGIGLLLTLLVGVIPESRQYLTDIISQIDFKKWQFPSEITNTTTDTTTTETTSALEYRLMMIPQDNTTTTTSTTTDGSTTSTTTNTTITTSTSVNTTMSTTTTTDPYANATAKKGNMGNDTILKASVSFIGWDKFKVNHTYRIDWGFPASAKYTDKQNIDTVMTCTDQNTTFIVGDSWKEPVVIIGLTSLQPLEKGTVYWTCLYDLGLAV